MLIRLRICERNKGGVRSLATKKAVAIPVISFFLKILAHLLSDYSWRPSRNDFFNVSDLHGMRPVAELTRRCNFKIEDLYSNWMNISRRRIRLS